MVESLEQKLFPHESFRESQYDVLEACLKALDDGYKNIILDAPVGTGKSALATSLLRYADDGFYTTPQRSLREQLQNDEALDPHIESLKARSDYHCQVTNVDCKECNIYQSEDLSCAEQGPMCTYWGRKQKVMNSDIAVITFSMLIIDGMLPVKANETQISFDDRDMVVVDEAHGLVQQVAEMHAGFDIGPYGIPPGVFQDATDPIPFSADRYKDISSTVNQLLARLVQYTDGIPPFEMSPAEKRCHRLAENIKRANGDLDEDRPWTVEVESKKYGNEIKKVVHLRPVDVSGFLKGSVWNRADKRIISTATLPHRNRPELWIRRVGLDPDETKVISVGMNFPVENRPVITSRMVGSMSGGEEDDYWGEIMETLNELAELHGGQKGICHTSSYSRAERVVDSISEDEYPHLYENVYLHDQDEDAEDAVENWQNSNKSLILSPSMMEGVDLKDEMARYNILLKIPYPGRDSRTEYLLEETDYGWSEYFSRAAVRTAQAYGRIIRSKDDWGNFYILDEDYNKLKKKASLPNWIVEAEGVAPVNTRSLMDF